MCIDDNVALVDALERRLMLEPGFTQLHRLIDFDDAIGSVARAHPSIVVLDIDLPNGMDALSILGDIVAQVPESRVIILTGHPTAALVAQSMSIGAWGFVSKGVRADRLIESIHRVLRGEAVIELHD
ncbi:response regulator [Gemmatimonas groenlandica]|uniref:Response regulator transcription factor n=1 Tax=Gemmatimonas groenlandica TaxID=2732249 RepID=A0A6M4IMN2_9BACT|nr:response regulator transcription factor [Gemmatimonas groenlandica]QJR35943.1 response regulator transcription factor [Gemmatimonas groenlandica]